MKNVIIVFLCLVVAGFITSCKKDKPPKAIVTVVNAAGEVVGGATVKVYSDPRYYNEIVVNGTDTSYMYDPVGYYDPDIHQLYDVQTTNSAGQTEHNFKYESIYNVEVKFPYKVSNHVWDTLRGEGALILKINETYNETVIIR